MRKNPWYILWLVPASAGEGCALFLALWQMLVQIREVDPVAGRVLLNGTAGNFLFLCAAGALLPAFALTAKEKLETLHLLVCAAMPWFLLLPLLCLRPGMLSLCLGAWCIGWGVFRIGWTFGGRWKMEEAESKHEMVLSVLLWLVCAAYGYKNQLHFHRALVWIYGDWTQYAEHYLALLSGKASLGAWFAGAGHFNLLPNVLMTALLAIRRAPETIFAVNALAVSSAVPLAVRLCRKRGASLGAALTVGLAAAVNPALTHQYTGFIYGFHPVVLLIPLILGFLLLEKSPWRWVLFAASLLVQETAAVFWFGYGMVCLMHKKYRTGTALLLTMPCFFWAVGRWGMPLALGVEHYAQLFHYTALGNSLGEAALSPVLRPAAFFGALFQMESVTFVLAVLVPWWFACGRKWRELAAVLPLALGVCLQDSAAVKNVAMQYSVECTVWALAVSAAVFQKKLSVPRWWRLGLPEGDAVAGSVLGLLAVSLMCWILFGFAVPYGKYTQNRAVICRDMRPVVRACLANHPAPRRVIATDRERSHFLFDFPTFPVTAEPQEGDLVVLGLHDDLSGEMPRVEALRRKLAGMSRAKSIPAESSGVEEFAVYRILDHDSERERLPWMDETSFENFGTPGESDNGNFEWRFRPEEDGWVIGVRVLNVPQDDVDVLIGTDAGIIIRAFGSGRVPAYMAEPGSVFECKLPRGAGRIREVRIVSRGGGQTLRKESAAPEGEKEKKR